MNWFSFSSFDSWQEAMDQARDDGAVLWNGDSDVISGNIYGTLADDLYILVCDVHTPAGKIVSWRWKQANIISVAGLEEKGFS